MENSFRDKVALVTGGASGIGKAACLKFSEQGSKVIILDMHFKAGKVLEKEINYKVSEAIFICYDLAVERDQISHSWCSKVF